MDSISFKYFMPTRVIMGRDCISKNSKIFRTLGTKALLVTGARSAKENGSQQDVIAALEKEGISYYIFDRVMSNPSISCVYEGAHIAKEEKVDFIIAIGGGSPMDAGKAIALLAVQDIPEEELFNRTREDKILPLAVVPTTAGTGSEVTQYSVLTNEKAETKTSIANPILFPKVAFLDAKYMENLAVDTTINTAIDALSHAVEGFLSVRASAMTDILALESLRLITACFPDLKRFRKSQGSGEFPLAKREQLLYASYLAGIVIAQTGTTAVHSMGYSLTFFKGVDHGRANGLLLGEYLKFIEQKQREPVAKMLSAMDLATAQDFQLLLNELLGEEKETVSSEEINHYCQIAIRAKNIDSGIVKLGLEDIRHIFEQSLK
ncbi:MAG: iron-containing alcohol dehydrogenase family protein [Desulfitobacteriia bacterium]|jgi:alcohol dehydrogenase class IV